MDNLDSIDFGTIIKQLKSLEGKIVDLNISIKELHLTTVNLNTNFLENIIRAEKNAIKIENFNKWLRGLTIALVVLTLILVAVGILQIKLFLK